MTLFVSADSLRNWAEKLEARAVLPHIVRRLVLATGKGITELDFPAYESVQRPGFDGVVTCVEGNAWLPTGKSVWELSTEDGVRGKAQGDFDKRTINANTKTPKELQKQSCFIFLTPRRFNQKAEWAAEQSRCPDCHWRDVRAYDADDLEQWVDSAPAGIQAWHRILIAADPQLLRENRDAEMPRASQFELANALEKSGYSRGRSEQISRASGGSIAILKHRLAPNGTKRFPAWAADVSSEAITASLLLGGWEDGAADVEMFAKIAGRLYTDCQIDIQRMASGHDPLLLHAANKWRLISKDFAWSLFENHVSRAAIERFQSLAIEILADDDPRFQLPEKERFFANIHGHIPKYSSTLKQHVAETLAFLGSFGSRLIVSSSIDIEASVNRIVASVLSPSVTWHRWASLGSRLPLIAEASPASFLRALRNDLLQVDSKLGKLLHEEEDTMLGRCNHSGLLWALEVLAWPQEHVGEVVEFLLRLVELDTGEKKWGNRPVGSIGEILSYWMPQTTADVDDRIKLLDLMLRVHPETAWQVLLSLLPSQSGGVSMPTHKPYWRDWANEWVAGASRQESMTFITATAERIIRHAGQNADRWCDVLGQLGQFPYTTRAQFMQSLNAFADSEIADADRRCVSELLSKQINRHRHFQDSHWSIPVDTLDDLELVLDKLKPSSSVLRNAWLFAQWPDRFFDGKGTVEESEKALDVSRTNAIREILSEEGFSGIEQLSELAESAYTVGWSLANATDGQFFALMIPAKIGGQPKERDFAGGFIWKQYWPDNWEWIDTALQQCSDDRAAANLLLALRFHPNVWERAATRGDDVSDTYWKECRLPAHGKMGRLMNSNS